MQRRATPAEASYCFSGDEHRKKATGKNFLGF